MRSLWTCEWDRPRPYVHPLLAPNGAVLTVDGPADHPWHHGLWFAIKFVNGENFWEEYGEFGLLHTTEVVDDGAATSASIEWTRPNSDEVVVREQRTLRHVALDDDSYAIDWEERLVPAVDVVFDRTPYTTWGGYGGLTLRGAPDFVDTRLLLDDGEHGELRGERSAWCAIDGTGTTRDGRKVQAGIVIVDHPNNTNAPTPWYASTRAETYGDGWANFVNAAFLWDGPVAVAGGAVFAHRHRVIVHSGNWSGDEAAAAVRRWSL
jgi:hypothetical protein